jgi:F0F1-type ATP synthase assembly protein I
MNNKPTYWVIAGIIIGVAIGFVLDNIPAGLCLGAAVGILSMLVAFTTVENKTNTDR